uniref:Uncharacterized protein n=1 Tax=Arundo donax TaxID=35708 RepID=A0A0A8XYP6_ARUDO
MPHFWVVAIASVADILIFCSLLSLLFQFIWLFSSMIADSIVYVSCR